MVSRLRIPAICSERLFATTNTLLQESRSRDSRWSAPDGHCRLSLRSACHSHILTWSQAGLPTTAQARQSADGRRQERQSARWRHMEGFAPPGIPSRRRTRALPPFRNGSRMDSVVKEQHSPTPRQPLKTSSEPRDYSDPFISLSGLPEPLSGGVPPGSDDVPRISRDVNAGERVIPQGERLPEALRAPFPVLPVSFPMGNASRKGGNATFPFSQLGEKAGKETFPRFRVLFPVGNTARKRGNGPFPLLQATEGRGTTRSPPSLSHSPWGTRREAEGTRPKSCS